MIGSFFHVLSWLFEMGVFIFAIAIVSSYLILAVLSAKEIVFYIKKVYFVDYTELLHSSISPTVSLIAPAYNEGQTIVENVRSLLSLHYARYEIIIVNDGSKDD